MPYSRKKSSARSRPAYRGGYVTVIHTGPLQKGGGLGGILKGWIKRAIPIVKAKAKAVAIPLAKSIGRDLAVHTLDSVYNVGRDILVNKKDPLDAVYEQGRNEVSYFKNKITHPFQSEGENPVSKRRAIKRRTQSKHASLIRNAKRKRANKSSKKVKGGFRKITL